MTRRTLSGGKRRRRRRALVLEPAARVPKCARASGGSGVRGSGQRACVGVLGRFSLGLLTSNSSEIAGPYTCGGVSGRQLRAFVRLRLPPPLSREQGWLLHWPSAARRWAAFSSAVWDVLRIHSASIARVYLWGAAQWCALLRRWAFELAWQHEIV